MKYFNKFYFTFLLILAAVTSIAAVAQNPFEKKVKYKIKNKIDKLVLEKLNEYQIKPANLSSDAVFLRRVYLDVIGTLPTQQEVNRFLSDKKPGKRYKTINSLLKRKEFADYQALKWGDLLRIKAEFPINLWPNAVQAYHAWVHNSIEHNMPYNKFVYELLTSSGSNFREPQVNFYRAVQGKTPESIAGAAALTFMGIRLDKLSKKQQAEMATFFSRVAYKKTEEWKEEIVYLNPEPTNVLHTVFPDGEKITIQTDQDPRKIFADWLVSPSNSYFARNIVNRIWSRMMGIGIINPPDDICASNPASNPKLLSFLEKELIKSNYNLRHIYRLILNSRTYQQSSIPQSNNPKAESLFAYYPVRQLDAEVLIDAICTITDTRENYDSAIPEPFTFIPNWNKTINLSDGSITSPFLEIFGRPARDTGYESERKSNTTAAQRLHLLNSTHIQNKLLRSRKLKRIIRQTRGSRDEKIRAIYINILSRYPTANELEVVREYLNSEQGSPKQAIMDIVWALFNSKEFLCKH